VLFNAAGALMVAGEVADWREGVEEAAEAIDKGLAKGCSIAGSRRRNDRQTAEICATKREEVAARKPLASLADLERAPPQTPRAV
jgi:hypothetical protein